MRRFLLRLFHDATCRAWERHIVSRCEIDRTSDTVPEIVAQVLVHLDQLAIDFRHQMRVKVAGHQTQRFVRRSQVCFPRVGFTKQYELLQHIGKRSRSGTLPAGPRSSTEKTVCE